MTVCRIGAWPDAEIAMPDRRKASAIPLLCRLSIPSFRLEADIAIEAACLGGDLTIAIVGSRSMVTGSDWPAREFFMRFTVRSPRLFLPPWRGEQKCVAMAIFPHRFVPVNSVDLR
jgi:hypothetical protein